MIKYFNLFFIFLISPIIGFYLAFYEDNPIYAFGKTSSSNLPVHQMAEKMDAINQELLILENTTKDTSIEISNILETVNETSKIYEQQKKQIEQLISTSQQQSKKSDVVLEQILSNLLGEPIYVHNGEHSTIKVYTLIEEGYRGFMAKIRPHTSDALKLVLPEDKLVSNGETTSNAVKRSNAILAVNAGGYWKNDEGKLSSLGTIVVDGEIKKFSDSSELSFVGFNTNGQLVGGFFETEKELMDNNILQGSSFLPTLLLDGKKTTIPSGWANAKHPRTIIGNFSNNELLFIVIDGRKTGWSNGVTLEEVQDKLLSFKVKDAFNLDGGGSSTFFFDGQVLNKPSDGKERPVSSNFVVLP